MAGPIHEAGTTRDAPKKFRSGKNNSGGTLAVGSIVVWELAEGDAQAFIVPTTAQGGLVAGVLTEAVVDQADTDRIQHYGIVEALVETTAADVVAGDSLVPVTAQSYLIRSAAGALSINPVGFTAIDAATINAATLSTVFVNIP